MSGCSRSIEDDLYFLSFSYLLCARELVAQRRRPEAALRLGVSEALADWLERATLQEIEAIARSGVLTFQCRVPDRAWRDAVRMAGDPSLLQSHVVLAALARATTHDPAR